MEIPKIAFTHFYTQSILTQELTAPKETRKAVLTEHQLCDLNL